MFQSPPNQVSFWGNFYLSLKLTYIVKFGIGLESHFCEVFSATQNHTPRFLWRGWWAVGIRLHVFGV
jgi:hypothetical protein